jgi:non-specific protein-tyrosine kinase
VDLRRLLAIARSQFPLLVAGVVLGGGMAMVTSSMQPRIYEAKATLIVGQSLSGVSNFDELLVSQRLSATYAAVATTRPILDAVIRSLRLETTPEELGKRVRSVAQLDSTLVSLMAQDTDAGRAADIANAMAGELIAASPAIHGREAEFQDAIDEELQSTLRQIETTQDQAQALSLLPERTPAQDAELATLEGRLASLRSTYATLLSFSSSGASSLLSVIEPAVAPVDPISPRMVLNVLLGMLLGLLAAAGIVAMVTYFRDVVRDADEVEEVVGLSTLGTIAKQAGDRSTHELHRLAALLYPRSGIAESYRTLRVNIEFGALDAPLRTLLVTSSIPGEGKTVMAANLAVVFAQAGRDVLVVDADLRRPGLDGIFQLPNIRGLTTLLLDDRVEIDSVVQATEQERLRVLTTGPLPPNPAELLGSQRMRALLNRLQAAGALVIFDSPPLLAVADAAILSSYMDGTLLVIDAQRSRRRSVRLGSLALARAGATVIGAVINRVPEKEQSTYDGYYGDDGIEAAAGGWVAPRTSPRTDQ